jgi:predicted nucleotidyltransferase
MKNKMDFGLSEKHSKEIQQILSSIPEIETAYIFGSRARNTYKKGSDIDIAILGKNLTFFKLELLKDLFEESNLPFFVDLISP